MGEPLNVFWSQVVGKMVNYRNSISTIEDCIALCKQYQHCQWWNFNLETSICRLKRGQGNPKREVYDQNRITGHRDSIDQCPDRSMFTPHNFQPLPLRDTPRENIPTVNDNNRGWFGGFFNNPCPNGQINTNCYNNGNCEECCTGGVSGTDGIPACIH